MESDDRWLLPDGIEEILPDRALRIERLRRRMLDLYHTWGYDLVIPPLAEFTTALVSGAGSDLDLMTFKITDQLSGRMMGVRADITPQAARIDAHSLRREGPTRLCYAGQVLYTRSRNPLESRCPIQLGAELFGEAGLEADLEVIALLVETLRHAGVEHIQLDLGHVGIYRGLEHELDLNAERKRELFELLQHKDAGLGAWVAREVGDRRLARLLGALPDLCGDAGVLEQAQAVFADAPPAVLAALGQLRQVVEQLRCKLPDLGLFLDLGELRGYHYHTGIVFAAFCPASTAALGHGGRYDRAGAEFGRARPATGFGIDLGFLCDLIAAANPVARGIFAPAELGPGARQEIARLRAAGERVVNGFSSQRVDLAELGCDRVLAATPAGYRIEPAPTEH